MNGDTQKVHKPSPITIKGVKHFDKLKKLPRLEEPVWQEQKFKILSNNETKILTTNESQRSSTKTLGKNNIEYHIYQLKSEKSFSVGLRGINHDSYQCLIKSELYWTVKKNSYSKNKNRECTLINLPLFFVYLQPKENNKDIYNIKSLCH